MSGSVNAALQTDRYPQWLKDVVFETSPQEHGVAHHDVWYQFRDATIPEDKHHAILIGLWPLFERFPQFLTLNILKCNYGNNAALNKARGWLIKNIAVEQRHAEWYQDWAECAGISRTALFETDRPAASRVFRDWCWHICQSGGLAEGMAATNFSIEVVTGDWCQVVWNSPDYRKFFPEQKQKMAMKWIQAHAAYDDFHPVEALDIIYGLLGEAPEVQEINRVKSAILKSYYLYHLLLDTSMGVSGSSAGSKEDTRSWSAGVTSKRKHYNSESSVTSE